MKKILLNVPLAYSFLLCISFFTSGCNIQKGQLVHFNELVAVGDMEAAQLFAEKKIHEKGKPRGEDLLWSLQLGSLERMRDNHVQSTVHFDKCEEMIKHFNAEDSALGHAIGSTAVNDNIVPYTGQIYDGVMVNTYKALNFMYEKKYELARVEFNRALDRQRRAKEIFSQEIQKLQKEVDDDKNSTVIKDSKNSSELQEHLNESYPSLANFEVYPDFVNPFATYMAGLFFALEGDYSKSIDLLKESSGMVPENLYVLQDMDAVEKCLNTNTRLQDTVWVIFENGQGPVKEEFRLDLPLFLVTNKVQYVGIALPKLAYRKHAQPYLDIIIQDERFRTQVFSDIDRVIQTEFKKDFDGILTRAIISASAKAATQYALQENDCAVGALLMAVYSFATTTADVRIWTTLPKDIQVARMAKPANGILSIQGPSLPPKNVELPDCNNAIVYVRMIRPEYEPSIEIFGF